MKDSIEKISVAHVVDKKVNITCPRCMQTTQVDLHGKSNLLDKLVVGYKCKCDHRGKIKLEKRGFLRKDIHLTGRINKGEELFELISIKNLSRSGVKFETNFRAKLQVGDELELEFRLDNKNQSLIRQKGIIRNSNSHQYGLEFIKSSYSSYEKRLGFYFL